MIEAIGGNINVDGQSLNNSTITQEEFIRLFLAQLNNQDPLEPVDNSEFLAQMAQFSTLEQSRQMNTNVTNLLAMQSSSQAINVLGKTVSISGINGLVTGLVESLQFSPNGVSLTVRGDNGQFLTDLSLTDVNLIRE